MNLDPGLRRETVGGMGSGHARIAALAKAHRAKLKALLVL
jgi:hypothetical protein